MYGQCDCRDNFAGKNCLRCKEHYWGGQCGHFCDPQGNSTDTSLGCHGRGSCVVLEMDTASERVVCECDTPSVTKYENGAQNTHRAIYGTDNNCKDCEAGYYPSVEVVATYGLPTDVYLECSVLCTIIMIVCMFRKVSSFPIFL
jgi:hypothetical protein